METTRTCDGGQRAVALGAELHVRRHRVARGGAAVNCSSRVNSHFTGRPVFSVASTHRSSVDHLLLAAETAADALGEHVDFADGRPNRWHELLLRR